MRQISEDIAIPALIRLLSQCREDSSKRPAHIGDIAWALRIHRLQTSASRHTLHQEAEDDNDRIHVSLPRRRCLEAQPISKALRCTSTT